MQQFTPFDVLEIKKAEDQLKEILFYEIKNESDLGPKKATLDNIFGYSKSLSVRNSKYLDQIQLLLN